MQSHVWLRKALVRAGRWRIMSFSTTPWSHSLNELHMDQGAHPPASNTRVYMCMLKIRAGDSYVLFTNHSAYAQASLTGLFEACLSSYIYASNFLAYGMRMWEKSPIWLFLSSFSDLWQTYLVFGTA